MIHLDWYDPIVELEERLIDQYFLKLESEGEHDQQQQSIRYEQTTA
jgi:hypothetical protein